VLISSLVDSETTIDELRGSLPELEPPSTWIWNEASERFGLLAFGEEPPAEAAAAIELVGHEPDVFEEFDGLEL
jgi:hypothetical protein